MSLRYFRRDGHGARTSCREAAPMMWSGVLSALLLSCLAMGEGRAEAAESPATFAFRPSFSITPFYQGSADLDGGGDFSADGAITRLGIVSRLGDKGFWGLTLNYDYTKYRFDNANAFGGLAPWDDVQRVGLSAPFNLISGEWGWLISPSVDYFRETGAVWSDALTYGAVFSGARMFASGRLGLGLGVFDRIEKVQVFPFIAVDWRLSENWRLTNPLAAGPTGPAGLEAKYAFANGWEIGAGGAYRNVRFRLDNSGPAGGGVGEEQGIVGFVHLTRELKQSLALDFYAGAIFNGQLTTEDSNGNTLTEVDFDTAPLVGLTISLGL